MTVECPPCSVTFFEGCGFNLCNFSILDRYSVSQEYLDTLSFEMVLLLIIADDFDCCGMLKCQIKLGNVSKK
jgi:hypothetical protein